MGISILCPMLWLDLGYSLQSCYFVFLGGLVSLKEVFPGTEMIRKKTQQNRYWSNLTNTKHLLFQMLFNREAPLYYENKTIYYVVICKRNASNTANGGHHSWKSEWNSVHLTVGNRLTFRSQISDTDRVYVCIWKYTFTLAQGQLGLDIKGLTDS